MAEVDIERKEQAGMPSWIWIIVVLIIAALIWWAVASNSGRNTSANTTTPGTANTEAQMPGGSPGGAPGAASGQASAAMPLAAIRSNPDGYFGQSISGLATVDNVAGTHGFWIKQDDARIFVAHDLTGATPPDRDIQAGDKVSLTGTVENPDKMETSVPGLLELDEGTRKTLQGEPAFLLATNMQVQNGSANDAANGTAP